MLGQQEQSDPAQADDERTGGRPAAQQGEERARAVAGRRRNQLGRWRGQLQHTGIDPRSVRVGVGSWCRRVDTVPSGDDKHVADQGGELDPPDDDPGQAG